MKDKAILFDMDGVIADTNPHHSKAFEHFFDKYQIPYTQKDFEDHMYGKHNSYIMQHFFGRTLTEDEIRTYENEKEGLFREIYRDVVEPVSGLPALLEDLKKHGFKLGVGTSAPKANMDLILDALDIRKYFGSTFSSENVKKHKPDPEVYLKSAETLGVSPTNCLVFEDSFSGVSAGNNAGMKVVAVLTSHTKEQLPPAALYVKDYTTLDAKKLIEILER